MYHLIVIISIKQSIMMSVCPSEAVEPIGLYSSGNISSVMSRNIKFIKKCFLLVSQTTLGTFIEF